MGKKRNTAKTGDQALYKTRQLQGEGRTPKKSQDNDEVFNEVDRFHNEREEQFLKLDQSNNDSDTDDDGITKTENVLDLGLADSSSDDEDQNTLEDDNNENTDDDDDDDSDEEELSSDSDDDEEKVQENIRDWGRKKSAYYHGDTTDLEIGQEEDDAFLEEKAAKEVQAARYEQMDEEDFVLSDDERSSKVKTSLSVVDKITAQRDVSKLSRSDKKKLLHSHHPELLPLLTHFSQLIRDYESRTQIVTKALLEGDEGTPEAVGATPAGLQYLVTKSLLQSSTALNVAMYLLLKIDQKKDDFLGEDDEGTNIQSHPIMTRLQQWNTLAQKLEDGVERKVDTLSDQISNLIKATNLMTGQSNDDESESDDDDDDDDDDVEEGESSVEDVDVDVSHTVSDNDESDDNVPVANGVLNEARFGLRQQEIGASRIALSRKVAPSDFGDKETDETWSKKASQELAKTVNSLEQKSATKKRKSDKNTTESLSEHIIDDDARLQAGFDMMDAELGPDDEADDDDSEIDDELNDDDGGEGFYEQIKRKSEAKKAFKKTLYEVAPKYPRMDVEVKGERSIGDQILKNRGLVPHKAKINRNPRVKKREQFRKALIRRKGNVREVRTEEGHKYGGETTGIKSGLSRSRKLGVK